MPGIGCVSGTADAFSVGSRAALIKISVVEPEPQGAETFGGAGVGIS
jgi:hypothetical protein